MNDLTVSDENIMMARRTRNEDVDDGQFVRNVAADREMLKRRDDTAQRMWRDYCSYLDSS